MELLKLEDIYKLEFAKFMHRAEFRNLPKNFENYFTRIEDMHRYNLRSVKNKTFYTKQTNTSKYNNWLTNSGVRLWGTISSEMKELCLKTFSNKYKQFIIESY